MKVLLIENNSSLTFLKNKILQPVEHLYVHIPFCDAICHYCDFAKTASASKSTEIAYFEALDAEFAFCSSILSSSMKSIFFGGGTPSRYTAFGHLLDAKAIEMSLEANPEHLSKENIKTWHRLGFNRISVGVQTFDPAGLRVLTRTHFPESARVGLRRLRDLFENWSFDLIYGWPGQDLASLRSDLREVARHSPPHLSAYCLTYEPRTVLGRRHHRGLVPATEEDRLAQMYECLCQELGAMGYEHRELANWSKPGFACMHNEAYWTDRSYLGLGLGAHSYLQDPRREGHRFFHGGSMVRYLENPLMVELDERDLSSWLTERIATGIRTARGVPPVDLEQRGFVVGDPEVLKCSEKEWFLENQYALRALKNIQRVASRN